MYHVHNFTTPMTKTPKPQFLRSFFSTSLRWAGSPPSKFLPQMNVNISGAKRSAGSCRLREFWWIWPIVGDEDEGGPCYSGPLCSYFDGFGLGQVNCIFQKLKFYRIICKERNSRGRSASCRYYEDLCLLAEILEWRFLLIFWQIFKVISPQRIIEAYCFKI